MLEHSHRDDTVESVGKLAVIAKLDVDLVAQLGRFGAALGDLKLFL
jgi:hypothetical protein